MIKTLIILILFIAASLAAKFLDLRYESIDLSRISDTLLTISVSYLVFRVILEFAVSKGIKSAKTRYSFRKTTQTLFILVSIILIMRIWIIDSQALIFAYGLVGAGVAISLQDVFKNFAGTLMIFISGVYRVGDRIEVGGKLGDVIDIGIFYTTLLELREWVGGDQATGRITQVPNGMVLSGITNNYTKDHDFIWDEIALPITYGSDWRRASNLVMEIVRSKTAETTKNAERQISTLEEKYYLSRRNIEPAVFIVPTDNWIELDVRYVANARNRRLVKNELFSSILATLEKEKNIKIASETITVSGQAV